MALRNSSSVHLAPCAGFGTPVPDDLIDDDGRTTCPVCGREGVDAGTGYRPWDPRYRTVSRHGFTEGPKLGSSTPMQQARFGLKLARVEYDQWAPGYKAAVVARETAVWEASQAGLSDIDIAEVLGIPRANVQRMRARVQARRAPDVEERVG